MLCPFGRELSQKRVHFRRNRVTGICRKCLKTGRNQGLRQPRQSARKDRPNSRDVPCYNGGDKATGKGVA